MKVQRLRVTFSRGEELKYITHLDLMRFWERTLRRASVPIAYTEGFSPHAQISLAAPLPVGTTSDGELMDVFLSERLSPRELVDKVTGQLPAGVRVRSVEEVGMGLPALQSDVRWAEYEVDVPADERDAGSAVERFLAADAIPWEHRRENQVRTYDIRSQVQSIDLAGQDDSAVRLRMRLRNDPSGSGRPEQVVAALGLGAPARIHRTSLILAGTSPTREAWRKRGRFAS